MAYSSTLIVEELTGPSNDVARSVTLIGPSLPHMGAEWSTDSTIKTTWYPGNNEEATQQILNTQVEIPSTWSGNWARTMMSAQPALWSDTDGAVRETVAPQDLVDALDAIFRDGQRLRVTWAVETDSTDPATASHKTVREGRCKNRKWRYTRLQDIDWEITFEWQSRGQGNTPQKVTNTRSDTVATNSAAYQKALKALVDANAQAQLQKFNPQSLTLGQIEQFADYPNQLVTGVQRQILQLEHTIGQVVDIATTIASQPYHIQQAAINTAQNAVAQAVAFREQLSRVPLELESNRRTPAALYRAHAYFGAQQDAAAQLARQALIFVQKLRLQVHANAATGGSVSPQRLGSPANIRTKYVTKAGDTPTRISQLFYKSPDFAVDILRANGLPWYMVLFDPGTVLVIPVLTSQAGSTGGA